MRAPKIHRALIVGASALIVIVAVMVGVGLLSSNNGGESQSLGKVKCGAPTATIAKDPIVHHDEPDAVVHMHQIFGNSGWVNLAEPNAANYEDLNGQSTSCRIIGDTAGYWIPCLQHRNDDGTFGPTCIGTNQFTAYYRPFTGIGGPQYGPGLAFPPDTRLVGHLYNWTCGTNSGARSAPVQKIPDCSGLSGKPGYTLTAHIDLPNCYDGVPPNHLAEDVGDTSDNPHYAYSVKVNRVKTCPAGFPNQMVAVRETVQFAYVGDGTDVLLSSDVMASATVPGSTLHADFWNAWDQPFFEQWVHDCVNFHIGDTARCDP
jgi:hypothetical protein